MTYFGFLFRFLVIPLFILFFITWREKNRPIPGFDRSKVWWGILVHVILAVVYTTPWDNYLVATGVWYYNPKLVTGIVFGYVPIEEYTFFVLETILSGLWWWFLARRSPWPGQDGRTGEEHAYSTIEARGELRWISAGILMAIWLVSVYLFFWGADSWNYLSITLMWALPAILPQLLFGADILWHHRKLVAWAILVPGVYLSLMDIVALGDTTWSISPTQTTGVLFFSILPLEEVFFFFITNILITFGMTLMLSNLGQERIRALKSKLSKQKA